MMSPDCSRAAVDTVLQDSCRGIGSADNYALVNQSCQRTKGVGLAALGQPQLRLAAHGCAGKSSHGRLQNVEQVGHVDAEQ